MLFFKILLLENTKYICNQTLLQTNALTNFLAFILKNSNEGKVFEVGYDFIHAF